jgi:hypothetical protein
MRTIAFSTVFTSHDPHEADEAVNVLRKAGLHPADLRLTAPVAARGCATMFPIEVPSEELDRAKQMLRAA